MSSFQFSNGGLEDKERKAAKVIFLYITEAQVCMLRYLSEDLHTIGKQMNKMRS
jgi:hypothetical protein